MKVETLYFCYKQIFPLLATAVKGSRRQKKSGRAHTHERRAPGSARWSSAGGEAARHANTWQSFEATEPLAMCGSPTIVQIPAQITIKVTRVFRLSAFIFYRFFLPILSSISKLKFEPPKAPKLPWLDKQVWTGKNKYHEVKRKLHNLPQSCQRQTRKTTCVAQRCVNARYTNPHVHWIMPYRSCNMTFDLRQKFSLSFSVSLLMCIYSKLLLML